MSRSRRMLSVLMLTVACAAIGSAVAAAPGVAATGGRPASVATVHANKTEPNNSHRHGKVRRAWPATTAHRPHTAIARWMARQVGPKKPVVCSKRPKGARASCVVTKGKASIAAAAPVTMRSAVARAASLTPGTKLSTGKRISSPSEPISLSQSNGPGVLELIRSFDIPVGDPSYDRLLNWSWTYDSAVAATSFTTLGLQDQAGRLLDQLAALQNRDGSIDYAFNVRTGESSPEIRAGTVAFMAVAFVDYDSTFRDTRYEKNAMRAANYLISLENGDGLVQGGPDVTWVSTQHNILSVLALAGLAGELNNDGDQADANTYAEAAKGISQGIDSNLLVNDGGSPAHFQEGENDAVIPLDTQALGVIYETFHGNSDLAQQIYDFAQKNFAIDGRSIQLSKKKSSYNMTYQSDGPFTGYKPYIGKRAPDVLWFEGTAEMRFATTIVGQPTDTLDASISAWWDITRPQGLAPLGADRTITNNRYDEYHVWPTAAAGAWAILSGAAKDTDWAEPTQTILQLLR